jgi:metal-responsive CopG/Arc/MetJ family transcriptional regulator
MRVTSNVDQHVVDLIDEVAEAHRYSRSTFIALILEKWALEQEN